jgi:NAD-dependent SIR2 family protein deacetylase
MDSIVILSHANWKLNMKRRELIKPDLNSPYTRLCKEKIKPSAKLFGEELPKHLKDMAEAKKVGQQLQKSSTSRPPSLVRIITVCALQTL